MPNSKTPNYDSKTDRAYLAYTLCRECFPKNQTPQQIELATTLASKVYDTASLMDDTRFTVFDFIDAIVHYTPTLPLKKLTTLNFDEFSNLLLYIAQDKRATYSSDPTEIDDSAAVKLISQLTENNTIQPASFVSVWDGETSVLKSPCKVDMKTKRVFDIVTTEAPEVQTLDKQYIILPDGSEHSVAEKNEAKPDEFWY